MWEIAYETDDHNEASGFLSVFATLGGGSEEHPVVDEGVSLVGGDNFSNLKEARQCFADIPVEDVELFTAAVLDRQQVLSALDHSIAKRWDESRLPFYKQLREHIGA